MTSVSTENNPFLDQKGLPKFESLVASQLTPAVTYLLEKLESDFSTLEAALSSADGNYNAILPEVERMQFGLGYAWGVAGHLKGVKDSEELRAAYEENQPKVVTAFTKLSQSRPLFDALSEIKIEGEDYLQKQQKRAVDNQIKGMKLGGVGLDGVEKDRFNEIKLRLAELSTAFGNNVLDATKAFSLDITDSKDMKGVPLSAKSMWAAAYNRSKSKDSEDASPDDGPWRITLDGPSYLACMKHVPNRDVREKIYRAYSTRASEFTAPGEDQKGNNVPLIIEILKLKQDRAKLLGFNTIAEQSIASKMAPSVEKVMELLDLILAKALPAAENELAEITKLANQEGKLMPWDITFWNERLKESKFDLEEEALRPYFALPSVLEGMFGLIERLFSCQVKAADGEAEIWHPDVQFFKIYDKASGQHIASFFLDPYSRPENKRGGAWMNDCIGKSDATDRDVPVAYLTCNGSPPVGDTPSLMTFRECETLFHETGHGLQHMLTTATVGDVAGINGVEWDAVELPSQFMENWCYDRPTVYGFAKHYETCEPLPEELFNKLKEQKTYGQGMMACRQVLFGMLDMELHANFDATSTDGETIFCVHRRIAQKCTPYSLPLPEDRFLCAFSHIFAGGYSAGYYSYKWAEVMSADAFGAFEEVGLDNEEKVQETGKKFRETVLSLGGGVDPMQVFMDFRGREPNPDALLRHNGLD